MKRPAVGDAFLGAALTIIVVSAYLLVLPLFESVELKFYDLRSKLRQNLEAADEIVLVAIDDNSLAQAGRWPWPRSRLAGMVDKLSGAGAKVVGLDLPLSEEEHNPGLAEIRRLNELYKGMLAARALSDRKRVFNVEFSSAITQLDSDSQLEAALRRAGNVVLPVFFSPGSKPESRALPPALSSSTVALQARAGAPEPRAVEGLTAEFPIERFASVCAGLGHARAVPDFDGVLRRERPVLRYGDYYLPSYAVRLVLAYIGLPPREAAFVPGRELRLGRLSVPLDGSDRMLITYDGPEQTFQYFSFQDVMNDRVSMGVFKGKIVIVGLTASGAAPTFAVPLAEDFPSLEITANVMDNILRGKFLSRPPWAARLELGLLAAAGLFVMFLLPRLRSLSGLIASLVLMVSVAAAGTYLFVNGYWVKLAYPAMLLALAYAALVGKRLFAADKGKESAAASARETNRMLGLSFQGQGMLDLAFEKFRLCPLDAGLKDALYGLALDFERKSQFARAAEVLEYIQAQDQGFKDIAQRIARLKSASPQPAGGSKPEATVALAAGAKPVLGRYEIEKELARGAMGIVYLGRDPKINRQVAIKTMALDEGTNAAETREIKERFFREAESAGTLNHPNIVRIFDAGEEQDVAYIAMELLDGHDFTRYAAKEGMLPVVAVLEYVAIVAEALDYAHSQGIVHRDIKPANIMLLKDGGIRVADFGIARITASSKTAAGTVMGTPSYMSPEQVSGKKVDGRSDLFSLSVVLYELLTGQKPFKGGEGIGTLLFQIANDPHPDILSMRADLPTCLVPVINRGLAKDPEARYARGSLLAADLRACIAAIKAGRGNAPAAASAPPAPAAIALPKAAAGPITLQAPPPAPGAGEADKP